MGYAIVETVIAALCAAGIRAEQAWPGQKMPQLQSGVAAVSLEKADRGKKLECVQVDVFTPASLGGGACQQLGAEVCDVMQALGAECVQNACQFQSMSGLFWVKVQGNFLTEQPQQPDGEPVVYTFSATVAGETVENLMSATAYRMWDESTGTLLDSWTVRLVEQITGREEIRETEEPFEIRLTRSGQTEVYTGCVWSSWRRVLDGSGLKQTRAALAAGRTVSAEE